MCGTQPNWFFKRFINTHKPGGTLLLLAEGEGRNVLYAAAKGWPVDAFDVSEVPREKATNKAKRPNLAIHYWAQDIAIFMAGKIYDAVGVIYVYPPETMRTSFHHEICHHQKSGGYRVFESVAKEQVHFDAG